MDVTLEQFEALAVAVTPPEGAAGYPFMPEDQAAISRIASELAWRGLTPVARGEVEGLSIMYGAAA